MRPKQIFGAIGCAIDVLLSWIPGLAVSYFFLGWLFAAWPHRAIYEFLVPEARYVSLEECVSIVRERSPETARYNSVAVANWFYDDGRCLSVKKKLSPAALPVRERSIDTYRSFVAPGKKCFIPSQTLIGVGNRVHICIDNQWQAFGGSECPAIGFKMTLNKVSYVCEQLGSSSKPRWLPSEYVQLVRQRMDPQTIVKPRDSDYVDDQFTDPYAEDFDDSYEDNRCIGDCNDMDGDGRTWNDVDRDGDGVYESNP